MQFGNAAGKKKPSNFTQEEDKRLKELILGQNLKNWVKIASLMDGRNVHQCRERWRVISSQNGDDKEWTQEEDELILSKYYIYGNKSKLIQPFVPRHALSQVKERLNYLLKQKNVEYIPPKKIVVFTKHIKRQLPKKSIIQKQLYTAKFHTPYILSEIKPISLLNPIELLEREPTITETSASILADTSFINPDPMEISILQNSNSFENNDFQN